VEFRLTTGTKWTVLNEPRQETKGGKAGKGEDWAGNKNSGERLEQSRRGGGDFPVYAVFP